MRKKNNIEIVKLKDDSTTSGTIKQRRMTLPPENENEDAELSSAVINGRISCVICNSTYATVQTYSKHLQSKKHQSNVGNNASSKDKSGEKSKQQFNAMRKRKMTIG
jgi:hypothetical protein